MKLKNVIKSLFIRLPEQSKVIFDDEMITKYQAICNHGQDDYVNAEKHIIKSLSLGQIVGKNEDYVYIGYFDMVYKLKDNKLVDIIRVQYSKARGSYVYVDTLVKKKWNKVYGVKSK